MSQRISIPVERLPEVIREISRARLNGQLTINFAQGTPRHELCWAGGNLGRVERVRELQRRSRGEVTP